MKHYLVTYHSSDPAKDLSTIIPVLKSRYEFWSSEPNEGLYFISTEAEPAEILEQLAADLNADLLETLYVFELSDKWAGTGTSDVLGRIEEKIGRADF